MNGGFFIRIIYSNHLVSINGIHITFTLSGKIHEIYNNKYKFVLTSEDKGLLDFIQKLESDILNNVSNVHDKIPQFKLYEQLITGNFKFFHHTSNYPPQKHNQSPLTRAVSPHVLPNPANTSSITFVLKISGVWTTDTNYGITYKFTRVNTV